MVVGIYSIRNTNNGKLYIGSSIDIARRWKNHLNDLNNGNHTSHHLQKSWILHGKDSFEFLIIETCEPNMIVVREQAWIDYYDSTNSEKGYNICKFAASLRGVNFGRVFSKETREKISKANLGRKFTVEHRMKIGAKHRGKIVSEYTRQKLSAIHKGKSYSPETQFKKGGMPWNKGIRQKEPMKITVNGV